MLVTRCGPAALVQLMRLLLATMTALAVCVVMGACAGYHFPGGSTAGTGTVSGNVVAVPCAPVEKPSSPCQGRPVPNLVIVFTAANDEQVTAKTDSAGTYAVTLQAGTWNVALKSFMRVISGPTSVRVGAGAAVVANFVVDSGIRVPDPAAQSQAGNPSD